MHVDQQVWAMDMVYLYTFGVICVIVDCYKKKKELNLGLWGWGWVLFLVDCWSTWL